MIKPPFVFNAQGYLFQDALKVLHKSAQSGLTALSSEIKVLEQQLNYYRQSGEFEGERDDEGYTIWDQGENLEYQIGLVNEALMELRKAFAIVAYHYWERSVQRWIAEESATAACGGSNTKEDKPPRNFEELWDAATDLGYPPNPALRRVVTLANTLKHVNKKCGAKLRDLWPDVFPLHFTEPSRSSDWADAIQLTEQHLDEIFNVVSKSGPVTESIS